MNKSADYNRASFLILLAANLIVWNAEVNTLHLTVAVATGKKTICIIGHDDAHLGSTIKLSRQR